MTTKEFLDKVKKDKKILVLFTVLFLLIFVFTYKIVSSFSSEEKKEVANYSERNMIPKDSIVNVEKHTKLSSYEVNKTQNIDNTAGLNSMIEGLHDEQTPEQKDSIIFTTSTEENADIVNDRVFSFKEKLLAKRQAYNNRTSNTSSKPKVKSNSFKSKYKDIKKENENEIAIEQPKEPSRRTKDITSDYGSLFDEKGDRSLQNHIKSVIHNEGRKVKAGSYVKIRLSENLTLKDGTIIPRNTIITSICSFGNQRVYLKVTNILFSGKRHSVKLEAFALDGYKGLYDETVIDKELAQSAMDEAITSGSKDVTLPVIGNISLDILKKKIKEQHTILREGEHLNLEFSKN